MRTLTLLLLSAVILHAAGDDDYKPGPDSLPQPGVAKGEMLKDTHTAAETSVFPGTVRDYQIYLPPGLDKTKPAPFMVFQDGVIYQAPVVFDNLIAKKEIPPLIGIFIKPGIVPAANDNALPRFNRSYEYDSVTDSYASFLINEFLPAITKKHGLNLSTDPNDRAIAGSSSGGICAFMVAWHRPDSFRRVFTSVGTYVGIHGADQLPVLVRKFEPKPIKIFLQSGENDNNLYCGDWWMANQMMERSLTWAGYDVNHAWGTGGHNQKHATAIFPDVLRWLWKGWPEAKEVKANPRGDSKWRGYEVVGDEEWEEVTSTHGFDMVYQRLSSDNEGTVYAPKQRSMTIEKIRADGSKEEFKMPVLMRPHEVLPSKNGALIIRGISLIQESDGIHHRYQVVEMKDGKFRVIHDSDAEALDADDNLLHGLSLTYSGLIIGHSRKLGLVVLSPSGEVLDSRGIHSNGSTTAISPDQTLIYSEGRCVQLDANSKLKNVQDFFEGGNPLCTDSNGRLYVRHAGEIHVCDQAGRVNSIIRAPNGLKVSGMCFGGRDLSEIFVSCFDKARGGTTIYKRPSKAHGIVSGQMPPIKPPAPKL